MSRVFLWGALCTIPALLLEHITDARVEQETLLRSGLVAFFLIAPVEEFFKLLAVWVSIYRSMDFQEPVHGLVYAVTAALGFACVENAIYIALLGPEILWLRAVFATPAHVMFVAPWGYAMGLARFTRQGELRIISIGFLASTFLHGAYDFVVAIHPGWAIYTLIPLMVFMAWILNRTIKGSRRKYPFPQIGNGVVVCCPACGAFTAEGEDRCSRCGTRMIAMETDAQRFCARCRVLLDPCDSRCPRCGQATGLEGLCPPSV